MVAGVLSGIAQPVSALQLVVSCALVLTRTHCCTAADYHEVAVYGLQDDPSKVIQGDMYFCRKKLGRDGIIDGHAEGLVTEAIANGAVAVVAEDELEFDVPDSVAVVYVLDVDETAQQLAAAFYGE